MEAARATKLLDPDPCLSATKQRYANKPAHLELGPTVFQGHLAPINLSLVRIEDLATSIYVALLFHSGNDGHAEQPLIVPGAFTFLADAIFILTWAQKFFNLPLELAVGFRYPDQCVRRAGSIVERLPQAYRRIERGRLC